MPSDGVSPLDGPGKVRKLFSMSLWIDDVCGRNKTAGFLLPVATQSLHSVQTPFGKSCELISLQGERKLATNILLRPWPLRHPLDKARNHFPILSWPKQGCVQ